MVSEGANVDTGHLGELDIFFPKCVHLTTETRTPH